MTMDPIHNTYDWLKLMRRKRRWRPGGPTVLAVRGAELVREKPSEVSQAPVPTLPSPPSPPEPPLAPVETETVSEVEVASESEPEEQVTTRSRRRSRET